MTEAELRALYELLRARVPWGPDDRRGALIRMGCHPLAAVLYLKQVEARARGETIRAASVTADVGNVAAGLAPAERTFIKANPGLKPAAIAVTCNRTRLSEVRICLNKDLQFRDCDEIDRRACRRDQVTMPPMRGG